MSFAVRDNVDTPADQVLPLKLTWSFGHESKIPTHNLSTRGRSVIFYTVGNVGILYDWTTNKQELLEGHKNNIECLATSNDKNWIASVDKGPDSSLIIWNSRTGLGVRIVKDLFDNGIAYMQFTSKFLLILDDSRPQIIYSWKWEISKEKPKLIFQFDSELERQHFIVTHSKYVNHFLTCGKTRIIFFAMEEKGLVSHSPLLEGKELRPSDDFLQAVFVPANQRVMLSSVFGNVIIWGNNRAIGKTVLDSLLVDPRDRILLYILQPFIEKESILVLCVSDTWIVATNTLGNVYFWNNDMEMVYCRKDFNCGSINHVSFTYDEELSEKINFCETEGEKKKQKPFECRDFTVSTTEGYSGYYSVEDRKLIMILHERTHFIRAIAVAPNDPHVCIADYNGVLQTWNFVTKKLIKSECIQESCKEIECMTFDPTGTILACGLTNGNVSILDIRDVADRPCFTFDVGSSKLTMCRFSYDAKYLTFADESYAIAVFHLLCVVPKSVLKKSKDIEEGYWDFMGKVRHHYRPIVDILYSIDPDEHLLYTLGEDRNLVIYDLYESSSNLIYVTDVCPIEQTAIPTCMSWYPFFNKSSLLAIANSEHKLKIHDVRFGKCLKVNVLPIFDSPIKKIFIIEGDPEPIKKSFIDQLLSKNVPESVATDKSQRSADSRSADSRSADSRRESSFSFENVHSKFEDRSNSSLTDDQSVSSVTTHQSAKSDVSSASKNLNIGQRENGDLISQSSNSEVSEQSENLGQKQKYFVFCTDHNIGLLSLPVDGNPYAAVAIRAHCRGVKDVVDTPHDKFLFSCGNDDEWVQMWTLQTVAVDLLKKSGGEGMQPYLSLLPDGNIEWIKNEIMNTVFALQLQRMEHKYPRKLELKNEILVEELDYIMPVLGYYPSEQERTLLFEDVKFSMMLKYGEVQETIELDDFIKFFVNHRLVTPITVDMLSTAFRNMFALQRDDALCPRNLFIKSLEDHGDHIHPLELRKLANVLLDKSPPSGDVDELYVELLNTEHYYDGDKEQEPPQEEKILNEEPEFWGELDRKPYVPIRGDDEDDDDWFDPPSSSSSNPSTSEHELSLMKNLNKNKTLDELLPEGVSKYTLIRDLLGFELPKDGEE